MKIRALAIIIDIVRARQKNNVLFFLIHYGFKIWFYIALSVLLIRSFGQGKRCLS